MKKLKLDLANRFPGVCFEATEAYSPQQKLASGVPGIDAFLRGGLPMGKVTEFGMPLGREGRVLLLNFLVNATQGVTSAPLWALWISSHRHLSVYPPAWYARGISPERMFFTASETPMKDLKRVIMNSFFKLIILDSPKQFSKDDCLFINTQARRNQQIILLIRDFFLSNLRGNIWSTLRINCWKRQVSNQFMLRVIRGLSNRELLIDEGALQ